MGPLETLGPVQDISIVLSCSTVANTSLGASIGAEIDIWARFINVLNSFLS